MATLTASSSVTNDLDDDDHDSSDRDRDRDRLSNLPSDIIYHIFSFLGNNDMARIMLLSKGFYHLAISSPYLYFMADFDGVPRISFYDRVRKFESFDVYGGRVPACTQKCKNFGDFLLMLMGKRGNNAQLQALRLHWFCGNPYHTDGIVHRFIKHHASRGDLHVVDINLEENMILKRMIIELRIDRVCKGDFKRLDLSKVISSGEYESVREELKDLIDYYCREVNPNNEGSRGLRSLIDCRSLRVLKLNCISIYDHSFLSSLISDHAPSLVSLTLHSLHTDLHGINSLDIKSSSLQMLELFDVMCNHSVNIICPQLTDLTMHECEASGTITIRAECLLHFVYSNYRVNLSAEEAFTLHAPNLQDVKISYLQYKQDSNRLISFRDATPIRKFIAFLRQIIQVDRDKAVRCLVMRTPIRLKHLCVSNEHWRCTISDAGLLLEMLRPFQYEADYEQLASLLEGKIKMQEQVF